MRTSNRSRILDAAIRLIDRDGVTAVTFDSVAAEAEVTRGGMMYHFKSREALIEAINLHLAEQWEAHLLQRVGKPLEQTTAEERHAAYIQASTLYATRAELLFQLEFSENPAFGVPWDRIVETWAIPEPENLDDPLALTRFIVRLAADGLWIHGHLSSRPLCAQVKQRVADQLTSLLNSARPDAAEDKSAE